MTITDYLAISFVVVIQSAGLVVAFMALTRRGIWADPDVGVDWTTTDGCRLCWEHGPYPMTDSWTIFSAERARDVHQGQHELASVLLGPVARVLRRLERRPGASL